MNVLLIGSGGREHALFWKLSQSPDLTRITVFPGNGGFPPEAIASGIDLKDFETIRRYVKENKIELIVCGPEQPLVDGIADALAGDCPVFGPVRGAARLEGSKEFSKQFMKKYSIPTAEARSFSSASEAIEYLRSRSLPVVVKADGLAAGKGVTVASTYQEAEAAVRAAIEDKVFGASGDKVLIEDFLQGEEASVFAICDGQRAMPMIAAQDHKRAFDNDQGPNTGGMGAYLPVPLASEEVLKRVKTEVLDRALAGMRAEGTPYRGLLYAGLMIQGGIPRVVEFNCRFGDPETQAVLRLMDEDLLPLLKASASGELPDRPVRFKKESSICIVVAADGYPGDYRKAVHVPSIPEGDGVIVFHAGTTRKNDRVISTGGRVLGVTATGLDLTEARKRAYGALSSAGPMPGLFYRRDIGSKGIRG
jgi:phosphoribosylamine--glycine ligase